MKTAPLVAASALGLLLLAFATANPFTPLRKVVPLDFSGIDTLEFHGGTAPQIQISSRQAAQVSYVDEVDRRLDVLHRGNRLIVTAHFQGYWDVQLSVPASVRTLDVQGARITAKEHLQSMQVSSSSDITWDGDIVRLDLRDTTNHSKHSDDHCGCGGTTFTVSDGHIAELVVRSPHGHVRLMEPDKIDAVYAWLGEKGGVSLEQARRFDNIHLLPTEAQLPEATSQNPSPSP